MSTEAPTSPRMGTVWEGGVLLHTEEVSGERAVLPPHIFSNLDIQIKTFDTLSVLFFSRFSCLFYPEADDFRC